MEQQSVSETKEMRPIPNWEDQTKKQRKIIGYKKRM
jgi:hypothetical protein